MKEKDITDHVVQYWDKYFEKYDVVFFKEQFPIDLDFMGIHSRIDLMGYRIKESNNFRIPIAIECKLSKMNSSRDLIFELEKLQRARAFYAKRVNPEFMICVLADKLDITTLDYMKKNRIVWFKYTFLDIKDIIDEKILNIEYISL